MKHVYWLLTLGLVCASVGCAPADLSAPTASLTVATATSILPSPTATPAPSQTAAPSPTAMPTPSPTPFPLPTTIASAPLASARVLAPFQLAWSPTGERIAITTANGLYLFEADDLSEVAFTQTARSLRFLSFSPNGQRVATDDGGNYQVWDSATGQLLEEHLVTFNEITALTYDQTGKLYIAQRGGAGESGDDIDVDIYFGEQSTSVGFIANSFGLGAMAISPDGMTVAVPNFEGIEIWGLPYRGLLYTIDKIVTFELSYSADGKRLVAAGEDGKRLGVEGEDCKIHVVDVPTGQVLQTFTWCTQRPIAHLGLALSHNGKLVAANNATGAIQIWNADTGNVRQTIPVAVSTLNSLAFNPDGTKLASVSEGGTLQVWTVQP